MVNFAHAILAAMLLVTGSGGFWQVQQASVQRTAAQHDTAQEFAHAKELIEIENCIDCEGGTQKGLEAGIAEMKQAIADGYPDKAAAYKLLDDAYSNMGTYTDKNPEEHKKYAEEQSRLMMEMLKVAPNDPEILQRYADTLRQDDPKKEEVLRRVVQLDPKRTTALYDLGLITGRRDISEGLGLLAKAVQQETNSEAVVTYVQGTMQVMEEHGCGLSDSDGWQTKARAAYDKTVDGAGDAKAMPQFKTEFLNAAQAQQGRCRKTAAK